MSQTLDKQQLQILHLDDDPDFLEVIDDLFNHFNETNSRNMTIDLTSIESPNVALNKLIFSQYDIFISDCSMPGLNCNQFLEKIHDYELSLPIVLLTKMRENEIKVKTKNQAGEFLYLQKKIGVFEKLFELLSALNNIKFKF